MFNINIEYKGDDEMFGQFTEEARKILVSAKEEMYNLKHPYVGTEHLVLSLLHTENEISERLAKYNLTYNTFKKQIIDINIEEKGLLLILKFNLYIFTFFFICLSFSLCSTPKRCSSSTTRRPRSLYFISLDSSL